MKSKSKNKKTRQCSRWSPIGFGGSQQCIKRSGHKNKHRAPMGFGLGVEW